MRGESRHTVARYRRRAECGCSAFPTRAALFNALWSRRVAQRRGYIGGRDLFFAEAASKSKAAALPGGLRQDRLSVPRAFLSIPIPIAISIAISPLPTPLSPLPYILSPLFSSSSSSSSFENRIQEKDRRMRGESRHTVARYRRGGRTNRLAGKARRTAARLQHFPWRADGHGRRRIKQVNIQYPRNKDRLPNLDCRKNKRARRFFVCISEPDRRQM